MLALPSRIVLFIFLLLAGTQPAFSQKSILHIPLNSRTSIRYDLKKGCFTLTWNGKVIIERAYAACKTDEVIDSRSAGNASYSILNVRTAFGPASLYTISFSGQKDLQQLFYVFADKNYCITQLKLTGVREAAGYMAPLVADNLTLEEEGDNRALYVPFDNDMWARYNASPLADANFKSSELTTVYNTVSNRGIVIGSLEQDVWKTGIALKGKSSTTLSEFTAFAGFADSTVTHDRIPHGRVLPVQGVISSPQMMIGCFSDWRDGMETFARLNSKLHPRSINKWELPTPVGWNSWGVLQTKLSLEKAKGVIDFFADSCRQFRTADNTLFIDLDAFWDNMTPGGLEGDVSKLKIFVAYCREKGFKPGIYWTPFADWGKTDRKIEGAENYTYAQVWTTQNGKMPDIDGGRAMDPTHPATLKRIVHTISRMKELGFEMIKIDFLGHGAQEADKFYDKTVTTGMQAFKKGMHFLDSVLDGKMLVYAAISPNLATARYVHARRIACDAFSNMEHTEYTLNSTGYGWWQTYMYDFMDADHVVFASEADGVNRARLGAALVTGTLITGDDFSSPGKWRGTAKRLLQNKDLLQVIKDGRSFRPVKGDTGNRGVEMFFKKTNNALYIAFFNYADTSRIVALPPGLLPSGVKDLSVKELFSGEISLQTGQPGFSVAAHDAGIFLIGYK